MEYRKLLFFLCIVAFESQNVQVSAQIQKQLIEQGHPSVYTNYELLAPGYQLEWTVNWQERRILFQVTVRTRGYVVFGLSAKGRLQGADIVIGGVNNGRSYFTDRYGVDERSLPQVDASQDWQLHRAQENGTHTFLQFSRAFDTCDPNDYLISERDVVSLIWAYGSSDDPTQEWPAASGNRGVYPAYLLDPNIIPRPMKESTFRPGPPSPSLLAQQNLKLWTLSMSMKMPPNTETVYQCTVHKAPRLNSKHHVVGFNTRLETEQARKHTHHIIIYRCMAPPGQSANDIFGPFVNQPGQRCYFPEAPMGVIPTNLCLEVFGGYAIGSRIFAHPDHTGHAFAESPDEYFVVQTHYDNSDLEPNVEYDIHVDMFYTDQLRPNEVGLIYLGHSSPGTPSILVPPSSPAQQIYGHCGSTCTQRMIPDEGIDIYGFILHTHLAGQRVRIRHFRGNTELPWVGDDSNYFSSFQTLRLAQRETKVRRGDHLIVQCEYDSTQANGTVVGGFATKQEMCLVFAYHYKKMEGHPLCRSELSDVNYMYRYLGVTNVTWDPNIIDVVATAPPNRAGLTVKSISDNLVRWTPQLRNQLQNDQQFLPQKSECVLDPLVAVQRGLLSIEDLASGNVAQFMQSQDSGNVAFPGRAVEYRPPPRTCGLNRNFGLLGGRRGVNPIPNSNLGGLGREVLTNQIPNYRVNQGQNLGVRNNFGIPNQIGRRPNIWGAGHRQNIAVGNVLPSWGNPNSWNWGTRG